MGIAEDVVATDEQVVERLAVLGLELGLRAPAERGDLDDLGPEVHVGEPEAPADDAAVPEQGADVLGARARGDVVILRRPVQEEVADAAADEVSLEAAPFELPYDPRGVRVDARLVERDSVANEARPGVTFGCWALTAFAFVRVWFDPEGRELGRRGVVFGGSTHYWTESERARGLGDPDLD